MSAGPPYPVEVVRDLRIPTEQRGVTLAADLYRPVGADPGPVLATVLPYRKDAWAGLLNQQNLHRFASLGYAGLLVDMRGTGSSRGTPRPPFHPDEADDGVAAVEWAAGQPWCDGAVGMWGHSYAAIMAMRTATRQPPALKAIVPVMGMIDPERDFVHPASRRGNLSSVGVWGLHTLLTQLLPPLSSFDTDTEQRLWRARRNAEPFLVDLFRHGPGDPVWRSRVIDAARIAVPAFCIGGWQDLFCGATIRAYEQISGPKRLLVGPWTHTMPDASPFVPADFAALATPWWDRWLRAVDNGVDSAPSVVVYVPEVGWREYDSWPPAKVTRTWATGPRTPRLRPGATPDAGRQRTRRAAPIAEHRSDPTAGALGALWAVPTGGLGRPLDQHDDDMRSLIVTSDPLPADLVLVGSPTVIAEVPAETGAFVIKLADVDPAGRSTLVSCGDAVAAGEPVALTPTCYRVRAGHRLRIALNHGDFPRLWPSTGDQLLRVEWVHLSLPVVFPEDGAAAAVPEPAAAPDPADVCATARWVVTRDFVSGGIEVRLAESLAARLSEVPVRVERDVTAKAIPSVLCGVSRAVATLPMGATAEVRAEFAVTPTSVRVTGTAELDGVAIWSGQWLADD